MKPPQAIAIHWLEIGELDLVCLKQQSPRGSFFPMRTRTTALERVASKLGTYQLPSVFLANIEGDWQNVGSLLKVHYRLPPLRLSWSLVKFHAFGWGKPSGRRIEKTDFGMFNRRLIRHIASFGPELHAPIAFGAIGDERIRPDIYVERLAGAPRSIYGVREIRADPIPEAGPGQAMAVVTRALLPGMARLGRAGAIQAAIGDRLNETVRAIVEGAEEAVAATDVSVVRIDKAGAIVLATPIAKSEVEVRGEVIAVTVADAVIFQSTVGSPEERARFADFVRTQKALRSVGPRLNGAVNGTKRG
jgi:hypothetical protein